MAFADILRHGKEGEQRFAVMHRRPYHLAGEENLHQRNEVEHHAQAGGVQRDAAEKVAGASQRYESIDEPDEIATQRKAQPKQCHKPSNVRNPLSLPQVAGLRLHPEVQAGLIVPMGALKTNKPRHLSV